MNKKEVWKDVKNYEGIYKVSNLGNIKSLERLDTIGRKVKETIIKKQNTSNGYSGVTLYKNGGSKSKSVHVIVAIAFLNHNQDGGKIQVDHINKNKKDNRVVNLQLLTSRDHGIKDKTKGSSIYTGVSWSKQNCKWKSCIVVNNKTKYLGTFECELEASLAYKNALLDLYK